MKLLLKVTAIVYYLIAVSVVCAGLVGFAFSASEGLLEALGVLIGFCIVAGCLILGAREVWKSTVKRTWLHILVILLPGLLAAVLVVSFLPVIPQTGLFREYKTNVWNYIDCHSGGMVCD